MDQDLDWNSEAAMLFLRDDCFESGATGGGTRLSARFAAEVDDSPRPPVLSRAPAGPKDGFLNRMVCCGLLRV